MLHHGDICSTSNDVKHNKLQTSLKVIITFYLRISELLDWPPKALDGAGGVLRNHNSFHIIAEKVPALI